MWAVSSPKTMKEPQHLLRETTAASLLYPSSVSRAVQTPKDVFAQCGPELEIILHDRSVKYYRCLLRGRLWQAEHGTCARRRL